MESQLQGNVCQCGNVWFTIIMPESDPSRCPFCAKSLDMGEEVDDDDSYGSDIAEIGIPPTTDDMFDSGLSNALYNKAAGNTDLTLTIKICKFCTNSIYLDDNDSDNALYCPYCNDTLVTPTDFNNIISGDEHLLNLASISNYELDAPSDVHSIISDELEINLMINQEVVILRKSLNPFAREQRYIFKGLDYITMILKLENIKNNSIEWVAFDTIKFIRSVT